MLKFLCKPVSQNGDILPPETSKVYTSKVTHKAYQPAINSEIPFLNPCLTSDKIVLHRLLDLIVTKILNI